MPTRTEDDPVASEQQSPLMPTISDMVFWKPGRASCWAIVLCAGMMSIALASLHLIAGLAYEFHLFFAIPVFAVAWYLGRVSGYAIALFVVALWFAADLRLDDFQTDPIPLLFNSVIRIFLFVSGVSLLYQRQAWRRRIRPAITGHEFGRRGTLYQTPTVRPDSGDGTTQLAGAILDRYGQL